MPSTRLLFPAYDGATGYSNVGCCITHNSCLVQTRLAAQGCSGRFGIAVTPVAPLGLAPSVIGIIKVTFPTTRVWHFLVLFSSNLAYLFQTLH